MWTLNRRLLTKAGPGADTGVCGVLLQIEKFEMVTTRVWKK